MTFKIGIIGAGAVGCFVGGYLLKSNPDVFFLGRARLGEKIKASGLTVTSLENHSIHHEAKKINWVESPAELPVLDLVIITTKSHDTLSAINEIKSKITKETVILSLQNGLSNAKVLKAALPANKIVSGMVLCNIIQIDKGSHFKQTSSGHVYLSENVAGIEGLQAEVVENILEIQYGKLIKNLNNAINALSNVPLIEQLRNKKERQLLSKVIKEALFVLDKNSIKIKNSSPLPIGAFPFILNLPDAIYNIVAKAELKIDPQARLSMWQDLELKRKTEIEFLNGEITTLAKSSGISAYWNEKIVNLIKLAESGQLELARSKYQDLLNDN
ncbi:2-dehydropantoate 2-reductase [Bacteriovorax sp. PP10]|uniref:2-dehydropantoate 2-reductase n=1 Tax=Bacteriovorax antarcticus TaxID=3088717 RepID=A0ABU5VTW9_9BACT|nr:2-dehydropantoate 2-reductase [Bacteriovorax sp. PP10]MEA9356431.1 2-dehydropantoate 2-reductase [Bacteriovorax sp. PP10]